MNTVKRLKKSRLPYWQRRLFSDNGISRSALVSTLLMASWLGTYLDLYFVGKQIYFFPKRPFPDVFSINIAFTLIGLPLFTFLFLYLSNKIETSLKRMILIIMISLFAAIIEKQAEAFELFTHSDGWSHYYSFIGYVLFLVIVWKFYKWRS